MGYPSNGGAGVHSYLEDARVLRLAVSKSSDIAISIGWSNSMPSCTTGAAVTVATDTPSPPSRSGGGGSGTESR
jgi:hypothetical protein